MAQSARSRRVALVTGAARRIGATIARAPPLSPTQGCRNSTVSACPVVGGLGISILTTPKGLMSGRAARKAKIGGELLCEVW